MSIYEVKGNLGGLFCWRQGFAVVQYTLELTMYPRLASDLPQSCLSLQSSGIIGMSRHTDLESKASREFLSAPSPFQWCCFHRSVSETHIKANTMFCSKAFSDTFCGLVLHHRRMSSQQLNADSPAALLGSSSSTWHFGSHWTLKRTWQIISQATPGFASLYIFLNSLLAVCSSQILHLVNFYSSSKL